MHDNNIMIDPYIIVKVFLHVKAYSFSPCLSESSQCISSSRYSASTDTTP